MRIGVEQSPDEHRIIWERWLLTDQSLLDHGKIVSPSPDMTVSRRTPQRHFDAPLMRIVVGVTDNRWAAFLRDRGDLTEANFW